MQKRLVWAMSLILTLSLIGGFVFPPVIQAHLPSFLSVGSYAQYSQSFSTGDIYELFWNVTASNPTTFEISTRSHGLIFNVSSRTFKAISGGGIFVIDAETWTVLEAYSPDGSSLVGAPIGEQMAFWISSDVNESTPIDTMYENHICPISAGTLNFDCLPTPRDCWLTNNTFGPDKSMKRWYDKETGIVLMIETKITISAVSVQVLETLNGTNIVPLFGTDTGPFLCTVIITGVAVGASIAVAMAVLYRRRKNL